MEKAALSNSCPQLSRAWQQTHKIKSERPTRSSQARNYAKSFFVNMFETCIWSYHHAFEFG
jgi:phosphatidylserine decarboxylase